MALPLRSSRAPAVLYLFIIAGLLSDAECGRRNDTVGAARALPDRERHRRLIPYMTFYLHQDSPETNSQTENNLEQSRYQGFNQGYNHGFVHVNPQRGYVPYRVPAQDHYFVRGQGQTTAKAVVQSYFSGKDGISQPYVHRQPPRLPHPPEFLTGFKPMEPEPSVTVTQSQEIRLQKTAAGTYDNLSPRPFVLEPEHNSLRPFAEVEPQRTYVEQEIRRPYVEDRPQRIPVTPGPESPHPFVVTVEPNSHPRLTGTEQDSRRPFVQFLTTTVKPQYYTPINNNHIYPTTPRPEYQNGGAPPVTGYDISGVLPSRITSDNLESSIKTLSKLLQILQKANAVPQSAEKLTKVKVIRPPAIKYPLKVKTIKPHKSTSDSDDDEGSTPGRPGVDYPTYTRIPQTSFSCKQQRYKGFFGDPETNCQVWHYCDLNGGQASFLCPNGTIFSQVALTCDWWFNVKCASTAQLYVLNERLYKYIIPQKPSFPEDFSGPLVDRYLEQKYRELEEMKKKNSTKDEEDRDEHSSPPHETNLARSIHP